MSEQMPHPEEPDEAGPHTEEDDALTQRRGPIILSGTTIALLVALAVMLVIALLVT